MKVVIALVVFFAPTSFASVTYLAGRLEVRDTAKNRTSLVDTAYKREVKEAEKRVIETCDMVFDGQRGKEIYEFNHTTGKLKVSDHTGKVLASEIPFSCTGTFPDLKSCRYEFTSSMEIRGEDSYLSNGGIRYNSTMKDPKTGTTWVTDATIKPVSEKKYKEVLGRIEKTAFPAQ